MEKKHGNLSNYNEKFAKITPDDDIQCRTCKFRSGAGASNDYHKAFCVKFPRGGYGKPVSVLFDKLPCKGFEEGTPDEF